MQQTCQSAGLKHPPRTFQPRRTTGSADSVQQTTCQTARVAGRPRRDGWKYSGGSFGGMKSGHLHPSLARIFPSLLRHHPSLSHPLSLSLPSSSSFHSPLCYSFFSILRAPHHPTSSSSSPLSLPLSILHSCAHCRRISVWSGRAEVSSS